MANTTFSGPIKAGTISNTTGTTVGDDIANVGFVLMAQSANITFAAMVQQQLLQLYLQTVKSFRSKNLDVTTACQCRYN